MLYEEEEEVVVMMVNGGGGVFGLWFCDDEVKCE